MPDNSRPSDESPRDAAKLGGNERAGHDLIGDRTAPRRETRQSNEPVERVEEETERVTRTTRDASSGSSGSATRSNRSVPASEVPGNTSETNPGGETSRESGSEPETGFPFPVGTGTGSGTGTGKVRSPLGPGGCAKPAATMFIASIAAFSIAIRKSRFF